MTKKISKKLLEKKPKKNFATHRPQNAVALTFSNGVTVSTIWGFGSYSDNHDLLGRDFFSNLDIKTLFNKRRDSNLVEVMIGGTATERFISKLLKEVTGDKYNPAGYLTIEQWLKIINRCSDYK